MQGPETKFARSGDAHIAYQVVGSGPPDLVYVSGWVSNIGLCWEEPSYARFLSRLASFARLILFDKRGTGLSDRVPEQRLPTLEQRMDDVRSVLDNVGSDQAALFGVSEGGPLCELFAATHPERTSALVIYGSYARRRGAPDYPWGRSEVEMTKSFSEIEEGWGGPVGGALRAPTMVHDERFMRWWATYLMQSASPQAALTLTRMNGDIDVRPILSAINVPTLILHRTGDRVVKTGEARYVAEQIAEAKLILLDGDDHLPWVGDQDSILDEIEEHVTGIRRGPRSDRVLSTVLFTDIVASTETAGRLGDRRWRDLLEEHHALVRRELVRFRGREVDTAGDGFLATFDGPARAIHCALSILEEVRTLGLELRAGVHTGECEIVGHGVRGIAVHIGARVSSKAGPGEIFVSSTVKDLVAGSGLRFEDRGLHQLKGIPDEWRLYAVSGNGVKDS
jgi:class 3 adenylate cyclase